LFLSARNIGMLFTPRPFSITSSRPGSKVGSRVISSSERPSWIRLGVALAASRIVGARSMLPTICLKRLFTGTPGPRMASGTRSPGS
jgi:hypothetical protein